MPYATVRKKFRLRNPGRRRRMTAKQIRFFGTKRQRAALRRKRRTNASTIRRRNAPRPWKALYRKRYGRRKNPERMFPGLTARESARETKKIRALKKKYGSKVLRSGFTWGRGASTRRKNVSSILVASIPGMNPGRERRKKVVKRYRRRRAYERYRVHNRRRRNPAKVVYRYRSRRRHNRGGRRRNPGFGSFGADTTIVAGIISGAAVTRLAMGFVPPTWQAGIPGYILTAIVGVMQGQLVGKVLKKPGFGKYMTWGGLTYLGLKVINDFMPSLSGYLPFGLSGLGYVTGTEGFYVPQEPRYTSMGTFVQPGGITNAVMAATAGKGMRGVNDYGTAGAISARRVGRVQ